MGDRVEADGDIGDALGHALAGADVERHAGPAPVLNLKGDGGVGVGHGLRVDAFFLAEAGEIFAADAGRAVLAGDGVLVDFAVLVGPNGAEEFGAFVADGGGFEDGAGFHGDGGENLEQVVLDHVAESAGFLVVAAAAFDADRLGGGDLDVVDVLAVPERLEERIAEAEGENVLDGFLAEVVIDAVELVFGEVLVELIFEFAGAGLVVAEGLFDDEAAPGAVGGFGETGAPEPSGGGAVVAGLRREIEQDVAGGLARLGDLVEADGEAFVGVVVTDIAGEVEEPPGEVVPERLIEGAVLEELLDRGFHLLAEVVIGHRGTRYADDGKALGEPALEGQAVEGGE